MLKQTFPSLVALSLVGFAPIASAEPDRSPILLRSGDKAVSPQPLELGPLKLYPALGASGGYDDNIWESPDHEQTSAVYELRPELMMEHQGGANAFQLGYQGRGIWFDKSSDDDEFDHLFIFRGQSQFGLRHLTQLSLLWSKAHERRGTGLSEGLNPAVDDSLVPHPDRYTDGRATVGYTYGATDAQGKLRFKAGYYDHSYDSNRFRTRFFDREEASGSGAFLWRIFPNTSLLVEGRILDISYDIDQPGQDTLDSKEYSALAGVEWRPTVKSEGSLLVGQTRKDFDASSRKDDDNVVWELAYLWRPRTYSTIDIKVRRSPQETNSVGDYIDTKEYEIAWDHQWLDRFGTRIGYLYSDQTYQTANRDKQTDAVLFQVRYQMQRWLTWKMDIDWRERDSDVDALTFDRRQYWLTAEITL